MARVDLLSTTLKTATFQEHSAFLDLEFRSGTTYRYREVPQRVYQELLKAESKGQYFNQHIRNRFRYVRIDPPPGETCDSMFLKGSD
jgi:lysyl-tRNA synthetase, class II